jgi:hypothetical protein
MSKQVWIVKESRLRQVDVDPENWDKTIFGSLAPGHWRAFPAEAVNREGFPKTSGAFAGFPCPYCSQSVLKDVDLNGYPDTHLYGCGCTARGNHSSL